MHLTRFTTACTVQRALSVHLFTNSSLSSSNGEQSLSSFVTGPSLHKAAILLELTVGNNFNRFTNARHINWPLHDHLHRMRLVVDYNHSYEYSIPRKFLLAFCTSCGSKIEKSSEISTNHQNSK